MIEIYRHDAFLLPAMNEAGSAAALSIIIMLFAVFCRCHAIILFAEIIEITQLAESEQFRNLPDRISGIGQKVIRL